jgi:uncharacterized Rmd1/YagE family protein
MVRTQDLVEETGELKALYDHVLKTRKDISRHESDIREIKVVLEGAKSLLADLNRRSKGTEDLVQLGWIVIVITALGVAVALVSLIIAFFTYFKT